MNAAGHGNARRRAAGQVLIAGFPAGPVPESLATMARAGDLGGFILFKRNLPAVGSLNSNPTVRFPETTR